MGGSDATMIAISYLVILILAGSLLYIVIASISSHFRSFEASRRGVRAEKQICLFPLIPPLEASEASEASRARQHNAQHAASKAQTGPKMPKDRRICSQTYRVFSDILELRAEGSEASPKLLATSFGDASGIFVKERHADGHRLPVAGDLCRQRVLHCFRRGGARFARGSEAQ